MLDLLPSPDVPRVIIYTAKITARLEYTCRFVFNHVLKLQYELSNDLTSFRKKDGFRLNYSEETIETVFQVKPAELLFESGIPSGRPVRILKDGKLYFFRNEGKDLPYDLFSAVFYFISRCEEWQPFEPDNHGRFEASSSILFDGGFHLKPLVDLWIAELADELKKFYPDLRLPEKKFKVISTIDIDNLYAYRAKGLVRMLGACVKDVLKADLKNLKERMLVLSGKKKDPFDIYASVSDFCFEHQIPLFYFFLFRTGTTYDRTVDPRSDAFLEVFRTIKENHAVIGLHPSYDASVRNELFVDEKKRLEQRAGQAISFSRQHFLRFTIRNTPKQLMAEGIEVDFSMGFAAAPGFRAGTSHPFYYYDFEKEEARDLLFVPFCVMDGVYTIYENVPPEPAYKEMLEIAKEVKRTEGLFISVFHERSFSDHLYPGFGTLYKNLHAAVKAL